MTNPRGTAVEVGCEDLSFDTYAGNVYSLSEYFGGRAIYSIPASWL